MKAPLILSLSVLLITSCNQSRSTGSDAESASVITEVKTVDEKQQRDSLIRALTPLTTIEKNGYDKTLVVKPKSRPAGRHENGLYCYFYKIGNQVSNFRFVIQSVSNNRTLINSFRFIIDGQTFTHLPDNLERNIAHEEMWQWSDERVRGTNLNVVEALAKAKSAIIGFEGIQYHGERKVTEAELKSIREMLTLYRAMGGTFRGV